MGTDPQKRSCERKREVTDAGEELKKGVIQKETDEGPTRNKSS